MTGHLYNSPTIAGWVAQYDDHYRKLITACRQYAAHHSEAGLPGHYLMLLVNALAAHIDELTGQSPPSDDPALLRDPVPSVTATDKQLKAIYAIGRSRGLSEADIDADCLERYAVKPLLLTKAEASAYIDLLKSGEQAPK